MAKEITPKTPLTELNEIQRYVTQERGTEAPYSGKLLHNQREGVYHCLCCNAPLFFSASKFDSGCGWPSFYQPVFGRCYSFILMIIHIICIESRSAVAAATRIWDTCFPMVRSRLANATVSTPRH
ncbi:Peptide methionine sulfoxide reductase MsrB [Serratia fonticola]|uniref:peptide-methionine (R)-S-oxide reductase n=1 Tax=Serratia fonticola TaxID=47917 RepID=A0A4U9VBX7_SERFO|nr:Peptide methionine sulfoxide reductase MsrB [Serratia fonticola]